MFSFSESVDLDNVLLMILSVWCAMKRVNFQNKSRSIRQSVEGVRSGPEVLTECPVWSFYIYKETDIFHISIPELTNHSSVRLQCGKGEGYRDLYKDLYRHMNRFFVFINVTLCALWS